jgi:hypothetical protein
MQRYVESGQPHMINQTREVVAVHKDRQMFPISLCVARLSGVGMDSLFIGVMRHSAPAGSLDDQVVKVRRPENGTVTVAVTCWAVFEHHEGANEVNLHLHTVAILVHSTLMHTLSITHRARAPTFCSSG